MKKKEKQRKVSSTNIYLCKFSGNYCHFVCPDLKNVEG